MNAQELALYVGTKIKEYRKINGWSQVELAERLGVGKSTIANYEKGYRSPRQKVLFKLADIFELSIDELFPPITGESVQTTPTSTTLQAINTISERLDEPRRVIVLETARTQLDEQERAKREVTDNIASLDDYRERTTRTVDGVVSAGGGISQDDNLGLEVSFYSDSVPAPTTYDTIALVAGHSMEPTIKNGDYLFIKATNQVNYNQIGVFQVDGENYVKKLKNGYLESLNPDSPDIPLDENNTIRTIGQVVTVYSER